MLIHGGRMTNGLLYTCSVVGWYWINCIRSFWNTTLPGIVATFFPSLKALSSVIEMRSCPPPFSMSASRLFRPRNRFCPPLAAVSRNTWGLVSRKLDGERASTYWRVKKATFLPGFLGQSLDARNGVLDVARGDQVGLLDVVEEEVARPVGVLEARVALRRLGDRRRLQAGRLHPARLPQPHGIEPPVHAQAGHQAGVGRHAGVEVHVGLGDAELVAHR